MATIKDVAKRAGVAVSTVSHALSGKRALSERTRARIFAAIEELDYRPNLRAQSLVTGQGRTVGILFPLESNEMRSFNMSQFEMIIESSVIAQSNGYSLQFYTHSEDDASFKSVCQICDGLLVSSVRLHDQRVEYLVKQQYPFVALGRPLEAEHFAWVDTDFADMVMQQLQHLVGFGHRHIVFLDRPTRLLESELGYVVRTRQGYLDACAALGVEPLIYPCGLSIQDGYQLMSDILKTHPSLTALAAFNDTACIGAYYALLDRGLRVPEDFSVITFTTPGYLQTSVPQMTAMNNTGPLVSRTGAEILLKNLLNGKSDTLDQFDQIVVKSSLILGQTTGPVST